MKSVKIFFLNNFFSIFLFIFAVLICQYTGNRGIFPIDSFGHFDSGFRVLNGEHPFKDFWAISGPFIDYIQSLIFFLFGTFTCKSNSEKVIRCLIFLIKKLDLGLVP